MLGSVLPFAAMLIAALPLAWHRYEVWRVEQRERPNPKPASPEELFAIVRAVIDHKAFEGVPPPPPKPGDQLPVRGPKPVVLRNETIVLCSYEALAPDDFCHAGVEDVVVSAWLETSAPLRLRKELVAASKHQIVVPCADSTWIRCATPEQIDEALKRPDWWEGFYTRYPGTAGFVDFSPAVLSEDGSEAIIYVGHVCDGLCGTGWVLLLRRTPDGWKVVEDVLFWIS